jgi:hypothetical protein
VVGGEIARTISNMDNYPRIPSTISDMNNSIEYNRQHDGMMTPSTRYLQQRQFMIPPQMLLQTAPSYVSANRSISNQSVSNRSVSNRSFATSSRPNHTAVTQEAERIAMATTQAQAAAQSILLTGGSQASALSTAKAAAKSVLQPTMMEGEKLPVGSTRTNKFRNRRKNRQHAEIIASMAFGKRSIRVQYDGKRYDDDTWFAIYLSRWKRFRIS